MQRKQTGFTIIELIVVIALLGILSAVALPRFINVTSQAHDAAVEGAGAGLATGIALLKAQAVADGILGSAADVEFDGSALRVNSSGYSIGKGGSGTKLQSADNCVEIWDGVLSASGPVVATTPADKVDYQVTLSGATCTYTYLRGGGDRSITYEADTGDVYINI